MSDFLTRLASRQFGLLPTVEPRVAALYEPRAFEPPLPLAAADADREVHAVRQPESVSQALVLDPVAVTSPARPPGELEPLHGSPLTAASRASPPEALATLHGLVQPRATQPEPARAAAEPARAPASTTGAARALAAPQPLVQRDDRQDPPLPDAEQAHSRAAAWNPSPSSGRLRPAVEPIASLRASALRRADQPREHDDAPVHVTIGRIEVTTLPAPRRAKSEPVLRQRGMSLHDYLTRRRGRGEDSR